MNLRQAAILSCFALQICGYSIRINPVVKTQVQAIKNQGNQNKIQLQNISNSTILQAVPSQLYQSHLNELYSTSAVLIVFGFLFMIISVIATNNIFTVVQTQSENIIFGEQAQLVVNFVFLIQQ